MPVSPAEPLQRLGGFRRVRFARLQHDRPMSRPKMRGPFRPWTIRGRRRHTLMIPNETRPPRGRQGGPAPDVCIRPTAPLGVPKFVPVAVVAGFDQGTEIGQSARRPKLATAFEAALALQAGGFDCARAYRPFTPGEGLVVHSAGVLGTVVLVPAD